MTDQPAPAAPHCAAATPPQHGKARPFLKWAGGKQQLLSQYERLFPSRFAYYIEPFVGSAAVFFHLRNGGRLRGQVRLCDSNAEIVHAYEVVRDDVDALIEHLAEHAARHDADHYYAVRDLDRAPVTGLSRVGKAARTIYLNKSCFNGLYRVNRRGHFNVPMGRYARPSILQEETLRAASAALQGVQLHVCDFSHLLEIARPGDFVYLDPPYDPMSRTANFTAYTSREFGPGEQRRLADLYRQLDRRGCLLMLSNSSTPLIRELYKGYTIRTVHAGRAINSKVEGRSAVEEVVVLNYEEGLP